MEDVLASGACWHLSTDHEPSEGFAPGVGGGTPLLLVEQNYSLATGLADRAYVLNRGEIKFSETIAELEVAEAVRTT